MERDVFYDTDRLSHEQQEALLRKAHDICETWWFDKLDCSESPARQRLQEISFEEAMGHFVDGSLTRVIHRKPLIRTDEPHLQVVFRSMEIPVDHFLWIRVPLDKADQITDGLAKLG